MDAASSVGFVRSELEVARRGLDDLIKNDASLEAVASAADTIARALSTGGKVLSCGNGGSMSDAMHFAEELSGRYRKDRPALAALALSDPAYLTCVANDYGYERVFARGVEALGKPGDVLLCLSTSGESKNILAAASEARTRGLKVVALTGKTKSSLSSLADCEIVCQVGEYADRVQELHIKVIHITIALVERLTFVGRDDATAEDR